MGIIRLKKPKKKYKPKYAKKSVYDDYLVGGKNDFIKDPNSLTARDHNAAISFIKKMQERSKKQKAKAKKIVDKPMPTEDKPKGMSLGEERVCKYLRLKRHEFIPEKEFKGMVGHTGYGNLRIDFYLPQLNVAIEYDGAQHFKAVKKFDINGSTLEIRQANDKAKDLFCKKNGIKMIRISYKEYSEIEVILSSHGL